jgi:hypothetical protein
MKSDEGWRALSHVNFYQPVSYVRVWFEGGSENGKICCNLRNRQRLSLHLPTWIHLQAYKGLKALLTTPGLAWSVDIYFQQRSKVEGASGCQWRQQKHNHKKGKEDLFHIARLH